MLLTPDDLREHVTWCVGVDDLLPVMDVLLLTLITSDLPLDTPLHSFVDVEVKVTVVTSVPCTPRP